MPRRSPTAKRASMATVLTPAWSRAPGDRASIRQNIDSHGNITQRKNPIPGGGGAASGARRARDLASVRPDCRRRPAHAAGLSVLLLEHHAVSGRPGDLVATTLRP